MLALFFVLTVMNMVAFLVLLVKYVEYKETDHSKKGEVDVRDLIFTETI